MKRRKWCAASCGPGAASGWYWTEMTGRLCVAHALDAVVVEVDVRDLDLGGQALGAHREAVVVRGDLDLAGVPVLDGLVAAAVAEAQLVGRAAEGAPEQAGGRSRCRRSARPPRRGGESPRPPRSSTPGRPARSRGRCRRAASPALRAAGVEAGTTVTRQPSARQLAQRVPLHAEVVTDDVEALRAFSRDLVGARRRHRARQLPLLHRRARRAPSRARSASSRSTVERQARIAPLARGCGGRGRACPRGRWPTTSQRLR